MDANITLFTYTNSKYSFIWNIYFSQIKEFFGENINQVVLSDKFPINLDIYGKKIEKVIYDDNSILSEHILLGLSKVKTKYIYWLQEDHIPYLNKSDFKKDKLIFCLNFLNNNKEYNFVRLRREGDRMEMPQREKKIYLWSYGPHAGKEKPTKIVGPNMYELNSEDPMLYSHGHNIFKTTSFKNIHKYILSLKEKYGHIQRCKSSNKRKSLVINSEGFINNQCRENKLIKGFYYYENGTPHFNKKSQSYQSSIVPYLNTILRGEINVNQFDKEITNLFNKYNFDYKKYMNNNI